jgi:hypothetical protein
MFFSVDNGCRHLFKLLKWIIWVVIDRVITFSITFNGLISKVRLVIDLWIDETLVNLVTISVQTSPSLCACKPLSTVSLFLF